MAAMKVMRPDDTAAGAMVYADWLTDSGDDAAAARWRVIASVQAKLAEIIGRHSGDFTETRCRSLHEARRTVFRTVGDDIIVFCFAARTYRADLYRNIGPERGRWLGYAEIRRATFYKRPDGAPRAMALRLVPENES